MVKTKVESIDPRRAEGGRVQLQPVSLRGRRFLIQFHELMREFGDRIPWLKGVDEVRFATNGEWFRDQLLKQLGQTNGDITPYQFVDQDAGKTFVGGLLHFEQSPEHLRDHRNIKVAERLAAEGTNYISCLQVRDPRRRGGVGHLMMRRAINSILARHGPIWGVVSDPALIRWYQALGAQSLSPLNNRDDLWIVHWTAPP